MAENKLTGELEKFSYALGMSIAGNLVQSGVTTVAPESFLEGMNDAMQGMVKMNPADANRILEEFINRINREKGAKNQEEGKKFLEENRKKEGVVELPSGLQYQVLTEGSGDKPAITDQVKCHYHGTLIDGTVFDSSIQRGQPAVFPVNGVIKGWIEALQLMKTGSKWRLFIPSELAYGQQGAGGVIEPDSTLIFDVELLEII